MDILDEIDASIHEKRSKWNYTPMREKSETDAIIDELLREFPTGGYEEEEKAVRPPEADAQQPVYRQSAEMTHNNKQSANENIEPYVYNEEQQERMRYEENTGYAESGGGEPYIGEPYEEIPSGGNDFPQSYAEPVQEEYTEPAEYTGPEDYTEQNDYAEPENYTAPENYSEPSDAGEPAEISGGNDEYNEYISRKYTKAKYEAEEEEPLYNDDEYDGEDDDDFEEFEEEMPEESGRKKYTDKDFNSFMDSANDGFKGDIPKFSVSAALLTILKIVVLAAFGALAVVGIINIAGTGIDKYNKSKGKSERAIKEELQSVIYPVVVTETADFTNASELTSEQLINIAVWEVVINGNKSVFLNNDTGEFYLPQEQMLYIVEKLFGSDTKFKHMDSGIGDKKIIYDEKNKQYVLPENTDLYTLRPVVTDIARTGDVFTVYADCYSSNPSWSSVKSDEPVKRVMITMRKTADYYNMTEMKTIPLN